MTGEESQAQRIFQETVREAALLAAHDDAPPDRQWFFREARWRCLAVSSNEVQSEVMSPEQAELSKDAPEQIARLEASQLAAWISSAPEPQRTALALYYLDHFSYREILSITGLKVSELARAIATARREFQAWLNVTTPSGAK